MVALPFYNWSKTAASNANSDANVNWAEQMAPSAVNDSARAMMASTAAYRDDTSGSLTTGGTSTAYTLTTNQVFSSLSVLDNQELAFTVHTTSGAAPTLAVDGLTAKVIRTATGVALGAGSLVSGSPYSVTYDNSAGEFLLKNQLGAFPASSVATASIADAAVTLAKLANLAQNTFIGRYTASTGVPQALTLSTGLAVNSSTGAVTTTTSPALFPGFLSGLELSYSNTTTFGIAAGAANDTTNATLMALASAFTKTTSAWALGTGNGGLDTGSIATSTWYHVYLIARSDTGAVDVLFSTSASSPTMPSASWDRKRRIGSIKTNGSSQWVNFTQVYDTFIWDASVLDYSNGAVTSASRTLTTLSVPTGIKVTALIRAAIVASTLTIRFSSPLESDAAASTSSADLLSSGGNSIAGRFSIVTDTSARIGHRSAGAAGAGLDIETYGWIDTRGK